MQQVYQQQLLHQRQQYQQLQAMAAASNDPNRSVSATDVQLQSQVAPCAVGTVVNAVAMPLPADAQTQSSVVMQSEVGMPAQNGMAQMPVTVVTDGVNRVPTEGEEEQEREEEIENDDESECGQCLFNYRTSLLKNSVLKTTDAPQQSMVKIKGARGYQGSIPLKHIKRCDMATIFSSRIAD